MFSYHIVAETETAVADNIVNRSLCTPDGLQVQAGLATDLAFDSYDEMTATLDGYKTLHDAVGIAYKNITEM